MGQEPVCEDNKAESWWKESGWEASLRRYRSFSISLFESQDRKKLHMDTPKRRKKTKRIKFDKTYEDLDKSAIVYL
jgi:hypothetical protein